MYLNTHTYYSLRYGTFSVEKLVQQAKTYGVDTLVLTDINNVTATPDFVKECQKEGIKPIVGIEFREGDKLLYIGIAKNNNGFQRLNQLLSEATLNKQPLPYPPPEVLETHFIYPFQNLPGRPLANNEWIGIKPTQVSKLIRVSNTLLKKMVVLQSVVFDTEKGFYLHKNLRAIDHNTLLSKLTPEMIATPDANFPSPESIVKSFGQYPIILSNTEKILNECAINFDFGKDKNKATFTKSKEEDKILLEKLALEGMYYRYGKNNDTAKKRLFKELGVIYALGFAAYFLITHDIITYSMSRGFYHVGRGSGANSIVAYCLKITDVDPIELNLYFERFLNPKRTSPPDFDIDYSWKDRTAVQNYIFERYGREHTALLGTTVTFKGKSIYRELGKVHGLPKEEIDRLTSNPKAEVNRNSINKHIHAIAQMMVGFPNQRSIHAGGVLISEKPITSFTALDLPPKGFATTQWDMYVAEALGFEKLDILSQRGIGHIKEAVELVFNNRGITIDVHQVEKFKTDPKVRQQLRDAETNGCFYIESPAMRGLLKKLQCSDYLTLVAASSIIRPGVARSGMMREYIQRFHHPNSINYIHPVMKEQLEETYGVMVYQEDVLKVCHHFAGLDLADADVLRRAMSGKFRSRTEFQKIVDKFFFNCKQRGYPDEIVKEVWRQIESFAGYSFSKAHSASYAVESFQSLYLKAYFPLEFQVAVINNFGGFYHAWVYFNELVRQGGNLHLPCVNHGDYLTNIAGDEVYMGFVHVLKLERKLANLIVEERIHNGLYLSLEDFIKRIHPGREQMIILIRIGALRFTGKEKSQLLWEAHALVAKKPSPRETRELFALPSKKFQLPAFVHTLLEDAYDEIELVGFPVTVSAFDMLQTTFRGEIMARQMNDYLGKQVRMLGRLVTIKYVKTVKNEMMHFATFLDYEGQFYDSVHFPDSLKRYPFQGYGIYLMQGKVVEEFGYTTLEVQKLARLPVKGDPRET